MLESSSFFLVTMFYAFWDAVCVVLAGCGGVHAGEMTSYAFWDVVNAELHVVQSKQHWQRFVLGQLFHVEG